jgi:hypothetical protein
MTKLGLSNGFTQELIICDSTISFKKVKSAVSNEQRNQTADKPLNRAQKTLSMHGIPTIPTANNVNRSVTKGKIGF